MTPNSCAPRKIAYPSARRRVDPPAHSPVVVGNRVPQGVLRLKYTWTARSFECLSRNKSTPPVPESSPLSSGPHGSGTRPEHSHPSIRLPRFRGPAAASRENPGRTPRGAPPRHARSFPVRKEGCEWRPAAAKSVTHSVRYSRHRTGFTDTRRGREARTPGDRDPVESLNSFRNRRHACLCPANRAEPCQQHSRF